MATWQDYQKWCKANRVTDVTFDEYLGAEEVDESRRRASLVAASIDGNLDRVGSATDALRSVLSNADEDLRTFLVATARTRVNRVLKLMTYADAVEDRIMTEVTIGGANMDQLISTYRLLAVSIKETLSFLQNTIVNQEKKGEGDRFSMTFDFGDKVITAESAQQFLGGRDRRDKVRGVMSAILKAVGSGDSVDTTAVPNG